MKTKLYVIGAVLIISTNAQAQSPDKAGLDRFEAMLDQIAPAPAEQIKKNLDDVSKEAKVRATTGGHVVGSESGGAASGGAAGPKRTPRPSIPGVTDQGPNHPGAKLNPPTHGPGEDF